MGFLGGDPKKGFKERTYFGRQYAVAILLLCPKIVPSVRAFNNRRYTKCGNAVLSIGCVKYEVSLEND